MAWRAGIFKYFQPFEPVEQINASARIDENIVGLDRGRALARRRDEIADLLGLARVANIDDPEAAAR